MQRGRRRGRFVTLAEGHRIFCVQEGQGPDLLLVHGFPSTSHDFAAALPFLTPRFRVTLFDHLGFGFSDKPAGEVSYSLLDQGRRAGEVARALGIARARVVGHDMGLTVAVEMLCRQEAGTLGFTMEALGLCNGSHLVELAHITPLQHALMTDEGAAAFAQSYDRRALRAGLPLSLGRCLTHPAGRHPRDRLLAQPQRRPRHRRPHRPLQSGAHRVRRALAVDPRPYRGADQCGVGRSRSDRGARDRPAPGGYVRRAADGARRRRPLPADGSAGGVDGRRRTGVLRGMRSDVARQCAKPWGGLLVRGVAQCRLSDVPYAEALCTISPGLPHRNRLAE